MKRVLFFAIACLLLGCGTPEQRLYEMSKKDLIAGLKRPDGVEFDKNEVDVKIYDNGGTCEADVVASFKGFNFFGVKEKHVYKATYLCGKADPNVKDKSAWRLVSLELDDEAKQKARSQPEKPALSNIEILKHNPQNSGNGTYYIYARIRNNDSRLAQSVTMEVSFYDKDQKIVGTGMGIESNIASGAERTVTLIAVGIYGATNYNVEVTGAYFQ